MTGGTAKAKAKAVKLRACSRCRRLRPCAARGVALCRGCRTRKGNRASADAGAAHANACDVLDPKPQPWHPRNCVKCGGTYPDPRTRLCGYCRAVFAAQAARVNCVPDPPGIRVVKSHWGERA